jgi:hypothetical protein
MSTFPSTGYEPLLTTDDEHEEEEEELSELPPTYVTTRGPERNGTRIQDLPYLKNNFSNSQ